MIAGFRHGGSWMLAAACLLAIACGSSQPKPADIAKAMRTADQAAEALRAVCTALLEREDTPEKVRHDCAYVLAVDGEAEESAAGGSAGSGGAG